MTRPGRGKYRGRNPATQPLQDMTHGSTTLVMGVGNELRGDDRVGLVLARMVRAAHLRDVHVVEVDGNITTWYRHWSRMLTVLVTDAVVTGAPPGTIHVCELTDAVNNLDRHIDHDRNPAMQPRVNPSGNEEAVATRGTTAQFPPWYFRRCVPGETIQGVAPGVAARSTSVPRRASTHGLGLNAVIELARLLNCLPRRLLVVGVEGSDFDYGSELSPAVQAALPQALSTIQRILIHLRQRHHPSQS